MHATASNLPMSDEAPLDLRRFFAPSSAALVGASNDLTKFGGRCFKASLAFGFPGMIYPVNPRAAKVLDRICYPSVGDLPETPDHVGIAVPLERVMAVLADCAARKVPFVTVYTAGFAETGTQRGGALQADMVAFARRNGIRLMGPNCNGFMSFANRFALSPAASTVSILKLPRTPGPIGVIAQSGGLGQISVMYRTLELGLGVSHQVSCGNQADIDVTDFAEFMLADPHTEVILMATEGIPDGAKLRRVAEHAAECRKPIVMLKFGRTEAGCKQSASHTGAVTGSEAVHAAAFRQLGIVQVDDCSELYQMAMLLRQRRWPKSRRAATLAVSGGHSVLLADLGVSQRVEWAEYAPETQAKLKGLIPDFGRVDNPTDLTASAVGSLSVFTDALKAIAADPGIDVVVPIHSHAGRVELEACAQFVRETKKTAALLWTGGCSDDPSFTPRQLVEAGVPVFRDATPCMKAVRATMDFAAFVGMAPHRAERGRPSGTDERHARRLLAAATNRTLTERASRELLATYGFAVMRETLATSSERAVAIAENLGGRVALKIESPDIVHKTEAGGIRLGLSRPEEIATAYENIVASARRYAPKAQLNGVLVQEMAPPGLELILGASRDAIFGPVVSVGLGGIHVEVLRDISHRLAPIGWEEARAMLRELRGYPMLTGVRSLPPRDLEAVTDLLVRLSWLVHDLKDEIAELDVNPLLVLEEGRGARVLDALVVRPDLGGPRKRWSAAQLEGRAVQM
jgi:acetyltransferase